MTTYVRRCALCERRIKSSRPVCREHWQYYLDHRHEEFMRFLVATEDRQAKISVIESLPLLEEIDQEVMVGREKPYREKVITAQNETLGIYYKDIARKYKIPNQTVYNIIKRNKKA